MKSSIIVGLIVLIVGAVISFIQYKTNVVDYFNFAFLGGVLIGLGAGLIFGSISGYVSKSSRLNKQQAQQKQSEDCSV